MVNETLQHILIYLKRLTPDCTHAASSHTLFYSLSVIIHFERSVKCVITQKKERSLGSHQSEVTCVAHWVTKSRSLSSSVINTFARINISKRQSAPVTQNVSACVKLQSHPHPPPPASGALELDRNGSSSRNRHTSVSDVCTRQVIARD